MHLTTNKYKTIPLAISYEIQKLRKHVLKSNLVEFNELCDAEFKHYSNWKRQSNAMILSTQQSTRKESLEDHRSNRVTWIVGTIFCLLIALLHFNTAEYFMSIRCFVPNNYLIWEATRPISNCQFCSGVNRPLILPNISQDDFLVISIFVHHFQLLVILSIISLRFIFTVKH